MPVSKKLQFRRVLSKLKYLHEELELVKSVSKEAAPEFESYYRRFCAEKNVNISELDRQHKERLDALYGRHEIADEDTQNDPTIETESDTSLVISHDKSPTEQSSNKEYQMTADEIAIHDAFSKLLKRIALVIHPDKIDKNLPESEIESRVNMFTDSVNALEERKYYILLEIAQQFGISTPKNYDLQIRWMKNESTKVENEIEAEKNTYNFSFAMTETDQEKENLIRKFLQQLFRFSL